MCVAEEKGIMKLLLFDQVERKFLSCGAVFSCRVLGRDEIRCISFSPSGKRIVVGSTDGNIRMFLVPPVSNFKERDYIFPMEYPFFQVLEEHEGYVTSIHNSHDGKMFITGSSDGTARIWRFDFNVLEWKSHPCSFLLI